MVPKRLQIWRFRRQRPTSRRYLAGGAAALGSLLLVVVPVVVIRRRGGPPGVQAGTASGTSGIPAPGGAP